MEDPDSWWPDLCFGIVFTHGKNVYRPAAGARSGMLICRRSRSTSAASR
ncbi:hypothetical protein FB565_008766 [Actinoplanes lutulentus]|nr:hypothetical protein [Actinoplanes lutulentus]